jgi:hypothetical protein
MRTVHHHGDLQLALCTLLNAASRRRSLRWLFAGAATVPLHGCGGTTLQMASMGGDTVNGDTADLTVGVSL